MTVLVPTWRLKEPKASPPLISMISKGALPCIFIQCVSNDFWFLCTATLQKRLPGFTGCVLKQIFLHKKGFFIDRYQDQCKMALIQSVGHEAG